MEKVSIEGQSEKREMVVSTPESFARRYQIEIFQQARIRNLIAYLETGTGKTLIAVLLIRSFSHMLRKPQQRLAVFLVPKVCLVNQQADVLEIHTDLKIGRFWGAMGVDLWDLKKWKQQLSVYEAFVMTPQILLDCLRHSFIKMETIKILIFDECHHARKKDPYAQIMNEFYKSETSEMPLIFGMTASPIYRKGRISTDMENLEKTLHSKIYTPKDTSELEAVVPSPNENFRFYDQKSTQNVSEIDNMLEQLKERHCSEISRGLQGTIYKDIIKIQEAAKKHIQKAFLALTYCLNALGLWCAYEASNAMINMMDELTVDVLHMKHEIVESKRNMFLHDARTVLQAQLPTGWESLFEDTRSTNASNDLLTPKVQELLQTLLDFRQQKGLRCIVFVERVITARVLGCLLKKYQKLSPLQCEHLASGNATLNNQNRSLQQQIIDHFRNGQVNVIVATSLIEEGLDIQNCNVVIRFDLPKTVCSLVQSRGRARKAESQYIMFIGRGNTLDDELVNALKENEQAMRQMACERKDTVIESVAVAEEPGFTYRVDSTGAIVNLESSVALIYYFCSQLPRDRYYQPMPEFEFDEVSSTCTLIFPRNAPINQITVTGTRFKILKQLVCLEACKMLHASGHLTDHLLPVVEEEKEDISGVENKEAICPTFIPQVLQAEWAQEKPNATKFNCYFVSIRIKEEIPMKLTKFLLLIERDLNEKADRFLLQSSSSSITISVEVSLAAGKVELKAEQVKIAMAFQERLLNILTNATLDVPSEPAVWSPRQYLLLPTNMSSGSGKVNVSSIDWACVDCFRCPIKGAKGSLRNGTSNGFRNGHQMAQHVANHYSFASNRRGYWEKLITADGEAPVKKIIGTIVFLNHSGHYYCVTGLLPYLDSNSKFPNHSSAKILYDTYSDYFKQSYGIKLQYKRQPLLEALDLSRFRCSDLFTNKLKKDHLNISEKSYVQLPPELCSVVAENVSASMIFTYKFLPSIMNRLEALLLAEELKKEISHSFPLTSKVPTTKILEAITRKSCLENISLESLETLGDSFLKSVVSRNLFEAFPLKNEGQLTQKRTIAICNRTLYKLGEEKNLSGYIRTSTFDNKNWLMPGCRLKNGDASEEEVLVEGGVGEDVMSEKGKRGAVVSGGFRRLKTKVIADVVEALIGAHLEGAGEDAAIQFMKWVGVTLETVPVPSYPSEVHPLLAKWVNFDALTRLLNYPFKNKMLLIEAITHASCQDQLGGGCYQRLEFLGDAILDYLITLHLYRSHTGLSPGLLSDLRSAAVNNESYSQVAARKNLQRHLRHGSGTLQSQITEFVNFILKKTSSRDNESFGWVDAKAPKVMGDMVEAIAGAILIDSGSLKTVWSVMRPLLDPLVTPETLPYHPVRELLELCGRKGLSDVEYKKVRGKDGSVATYSVMIGDKKHEASAIGSDARTAKKLAAQNLLKLLRDLGFKYCPRKEHLEPKAKKRRQLETFAY